MPIVNREPDFGIAIERFYGEWQPAQPKSRLREAANRAGWDRSYARHLGPDRERLFENLLAGDPAHIDAAVAQQPIGRFAEVAAACVWLLSDKSSYVTGTAMSVDGGYTAP